jgi:7-cyano-7-deazaguanine synthase
LDSTTLVYHAISEGYEVHVLSFFYGQKHSKELELARKTCQKLGLDHKVIDIAGLGQLAFNSALTSDKIAVPEGHYTAANQALTVVPNRNATFLSFAVAYAGTIGANVVFYGAHNSDRAIYADCRKEFVEAYEQMAKLSLDNSDFQVKAPFIDMTKSDIVGLGLKLKVPFEDTWSCYVGTDKACGKCGTCVERVEAFELNDAKDPIEYDK